MGVYARSDKEQAATDLADVRARFPILSERRDTMASLLSGGEQQMPAIARTSFKTKIAAARRAVARACAKDDGSRARNGCASARRRTDGVVDRTEGQAGTEDRRPRLADGDRADSDFGSCAKSPRRRRPFESIPGRRGHKGSRGSCAVWPTRRAFEPSSSPFASFKSTPLARRACR